MSFPQSPHLAVGTGSQVGILTLWTKKEHVMAQVPKEKYAVCAQLYSRDEGISNLLRSLLEHKEIRDIILVGADLNLCAPTMLALWRNGCEDGRVIGAPGYIDTEIPTEAITRVREHVTLHDLQHVKEYEEVASYIDTLATKDSWGEPEVFAAATIVTPSTFPYAPQHQLLHSNIQDASIELAKRHARFGTLHNVQLTLGTYPFEDGHAYMHMQEMSFDELVALDIDPVNTLTITIQSLEPSELIHEYMDKRVSRFKQGDPASNFLIRLHDGCINLTHLSPDGKRLETFSDTSAVALYQQLADEFRVSDINHALYLGYELARAQQALISGELYEQDQL